MDIFDDFDTETKGYLRRDQLQNAYQQIFDESGVIMFHNFSIFE